MSRDKTNPQQGFKKKQTAIVGPQIVYIVHQN